MKILITLVITLICSLAFSQTADSDYLVTVGNDTIYAKIIELKNKKITYTVQYKKGKKKKNIFKFADVHFADPSMIQNPLGIKIEKPEPGFAHVYFYRPYVYTGAALACRVEYNGNPFINIKSRSYYLHQVKAGEIHRYNQNNLKKDIIEINAKDGDIYFIRGSFGGSGEAFSNSLNTSNSLHIFQDNPKIAKSVILTMKKISPKY